MEILTPKKNIILDATTLSTLMSCARLTDFRFNHDFQSIDGKSPSLEMGSIVHSYLEKYYSSLIDNVNKNDAHGYGMTAAKLYVNSAEVSNSNDADINLALDTCELYFEHYKNDHWTPLEVEVVKKEIVYEDDEIRLMWSAKLDLIVDTNNGLLPVDHKTMKQRRDSSSLNNQFLGQCLLTKSRYMVVNKIGFQKSLKPAERFSRATINYSADRIAEWQGTILPYWAKMMIMYNESGYWPPNWTHCENKYGFCNFKSVCESDRGMREEVIGMHFKVGEKWSI
jgi:hypothetical protein